MLGKFLEVSVQAPEILESVAVWEQLDFRQIPASDAWTHPYTVMTDGRAFIGLHACEFDSPALTFVRMELARHLDELRGAGVAFEFAKTAEDEFHEAGFLCPDGQYVTLLESRSFSPPSFRDSDFSVLGRFEGYLLPVKRMDRALPFWAKLGLAVLDFREEPINEATLTDGVFPLLLTEREDLRAPALAFAGDPEYAAERIESKIGMRGKLRKGELRFATPEGLQVLVREP